MSVIINELEVVVETPAPTPAAATAPVSQPQPPPGLRPLDLLDVQEWRDHSEWRLLAH